MGLSFREIASRLQISVGTAHRMFKLFQSNGDMEPRHNQGRRPSVRKLDDLHIITYILGLVADNPE